MATSRGDLIRRCALLILLIAASLSTGCGSSAPAASTAGDYTSGGIGGGLAHGGPRAFTVGGAIIGVETSGLVLANGSDTLFVRAGATTFSMSVTLSSGSAYAVAIQYHPLTQHCSITNGIGVVANANVTDIGVVCLPGDEAVVHAFSQTGADGSGPLGTLTQGRDGNLYGTTYSGGDNGAGALFLISPTGTETVLHSFGGEGDGANPHGSLVEGIDGNFYGMTVYGGLFGQGVVFMLTPSGVESVLHSFGSAAGAQNPYGTLIQASDGLLYGMSTHGGAYGLGAVFTISTPDGGEFVIHSFDSGPGGQAPLGTLIQGTDGNLYGMAASARGSGYGVIFRMSLQGAEVVLHEFSGGTDGANPGDSLIESSDGNFYGLTSGGGLYGLGTAFTLYPDGTESVLVSFGAGMDGTSPFGALLKGSDGCFYVLTRGGGANGSGAVLRISSGGAESVVYSFGGEGDGAAPYGSLIESADGILYGVTSSGGIDDGGTVFQLD
jgi:uncharacterized repeat protein (TIGR03803 family)